MFLTQGLRRAATIHPSGLATVNRARTRTWSEVQDRIARIAGGLAARGIGRGDRVAILALNSDRYFEALFAVPMLGAIIVPLNTRLAPAEIAYILADSGARMLLLDENFAAIPGQIANMGAVTDLVFLGDTAPPAGMHSWDALLADPYETDDPAGGDDVAGIFYTGGTTGRSKGVMLTHDNLVSNAAMMGPACGYRSDSIYIHAAPMFHLADLASIFAITMVGGVHVFVARFDPADVLVEIARTKVTEVLLVPTMVNAVANCPDIGKHDISSLRTIPYGASPMPDAVLKKAAEVMPNVRFLHVYGMTEASPLVTAMDLHIAPTGPRLQSCGRPAMLVDVRIADANDEEVPRGTVGEVQVRGPNIMKGYWNLPDVTAAALRGGWYHSGDGGMMDADGYVYIVDRLKDMIISGGENIYSAEVESAISSLAGVAEVAVIGIPDERWGETVHAVVVPRAGATVLPDQVIAHARSLIAGFKCPRSVQIRASPLPLSGAGKVLKTDLRAPFWVGQSKNVS